MAPTLPALLCLGEMGEAGGALLWRDPPSQPAPSGDPRAPRLPGRRGAAQG